MKLDEKAINGTWATLNVGDFVFAANSGTVSSHEIEFISKNRAANKFKIKADRLDELIGQLDSKNDPFKPGFRSYYFCYPNYHSARRHAIKQLKERIISEKKKISKCQDSLTGLYDKLAFYVTPLDESAEQ